MKKHKEFLYKFDEDKCATCEGNCCIGEHGYIWINKEEIVKLSAYLKIDISELSEKYIYQVGYQYSIKERIISKENYACVFFDLKKKQCSIYEVRPSQCRTFPFWDYFKNNIDEVKEECPAIVN